jgi:hypothetical protein
MRRTLVAATLALLLWGTPALAGPQTDDDGDGWIDTEDNCSEVANPAQDDTDGDDCGNLCDADYDQTGLAGFGDFGSFATAFGKTGNTPQQHVEPISPVTPRVVDFGDFGIFATTLFNSVPGPSGTTASTTACP